MISARTVTTSDQEIPVFFPAGRETLLGILTEPLEHSLGIAVIILGGGGPLGSGGRNRLWVYLCRRLSGAGFHTFRFDYHGVGDSTGTVSAFRLHEPFTEDLNGAIRWLHGQGLRRFILIGSCFGSRTALSAVSTIGALEGMILLSTPVRDYQGGEKMSTRLAAELSAWQYLRRAMRPRVLRGLGDRDHRRRYLELAREKWRAYALGRDGSPAKESRYTLSQDFIGALERLVRHGIPTLFVYGNSEDFYREFERAREGRLGHMLEKADARASIVTLPGTVHGFTSVAVQEATVSLISDWLVQRFVPNPD